MNISGSFTSGAAWFLNGLSNIQNQLGEVQKQLSSGYRIQDAADSPAQTPELVRLGASLAAFQNWQTNLARVQAETNTADQSLNTAINLIQSAQTLAVSGANSTSTASDRNALATQIQGIQQQLVAIANTTVEGRYIFGGDIDQSAPYDYNAASPTGVDRLTTQSSTRAIRDVQGQAVYVGLTARQIFDPGDASGVPTAGNTFAALQSLVTALQSNDTAGITQSIGLLDTVSSYVNQQQAYYGNAEQRIASEQNDASNQVTALQTQISGIRDTDVAQAATALTQLTTDQSAALAAQAQAPRKSLFDYLG